MVKVSGSYESIIRGVSEQSPQDRRPGQHTEQVNIISDPVRGAARRHGSVMQDEAVLAPYSASAFTDLLSDTQNHRTVTFSVGGVFYDLTIRTSAAVSALGFAWAFNRSTHKFIPVVLASSDPVLDQLVAGGMSASVNIGKYLFLAGNTITTASTRTDRWGDPANQHKAVIWIRGGAYARTFKATVIMNDGTRYEASYKTKSASYPDLLDTTDLLTADPDYQKKVNDRVNDYNSRATAWIGQAAEDITPENIAQKLADQLTTAGLSGVSRQNGHVIIDTANIREITSDDGGDNSLIHAVANEVAAAELVSTIHYVGKVVRVRPKRSNGDDAFYLEAFAKEDGATSWTEVYWREAAGVSTQPTSAVVLATVVGDTLYMASTAAGLAALTGITDVPGYKPSDVGDELTCPVPYFLGKTIDYLGVFQDRLVIGSDAVLLFSRPGDYFNWFRQSVLTVADDDPVEEYALGSEDDVITSSATFNTDRVFFGKRFWYSLSGSQPLTPKSNAIVTLREEPGANAVAPTASDNFVFYCKASSKLGKDRTKVYQMQAGLLADSPEGEDVSAQLDRYLQGDPLAILALATPNMVFVRTTGSRQTLYTYTYLDNKQSGQRLFDSWSKWTWHERTGSLVGLSRDEADILVYMVRHGKDASGSDKIWIACERFTLETGLSARPYADSLRPISAYQAGTGYITAASGLGDIGCAAIDDTSEYRLVGRPLSQITQLTDAYGSSIPAWVGINYDAYLTPTNPFIMDRNDRAITECRLTLEIARAHVVDTGGATISVTSSRGTQQVKEFIGRIIGAPSNVLGRQPVVDTIVSGVVAKEVRECSYTISALRWLPLTMSGISWTGQYFNNTRRV